MWSIINVFTSRLLFFRKSFETYKWNILLTFCMCDCVKDNDMKCLSKLKLQPYCMDKNIKMSYRVKCTLWYFEKEVHTNVQLHYHTTYRIVLICFASFNLTCLYYFRFYPNFVKTDQNSQFTYNWNWCLTTSTYFKNIIYISSIHLKKYIYFLNVPKEQKGANFVGSSCPFLIILTLCRTDLVWSYCLF